MVNYSLLVHRQAIDPEVQRFREKWYSTEEAREELKRRKSSIPVQYAELSPDEITPVPGKPGLGRVDISKYTPMWEDVDTLLLQQPWYLFWKKPVGIRLTGIDAPEITHPGDPTSWFRFQQEQPFGREALRRLEEWSTGKPLEVLVGTGKNQQTYGRYLGVVSAGDTAVNIEAVRQGWAAALPFGEAGSDILPRNELMGLEREAFSQRRGMWGEEYWQKYIGVTNALGGRITFTSLTDLTRLSKNYHLAAMESYMRQGSRDRYIERHIGKKLIPSYGRFFSGHNSAYNTIEGMRHGGWAGQMRPHNTDFGSGFIAEAYGSMKAFLESKKSSLGGIAKKWLKSQDIARVPVKVTDIGKFPAQAGVKWHPNNPLSYEDFLAAIRGCGVSGEPKGLLFWGGKEVRDIQSLALMGKKPPETPLIRPALFTHELSEIAYSGKKGGMPQFGGGHHSAGVLVEETLMAMKYGGRKGFEEIKAFREFEFAEALEKLEQGALGPFRDTTEAAEIINSYIGRVRKIHSTMEKNWLPKFDDVVVSQKTPLSSTKSFEEWAGTPEAQAATVARFGSSTNTSSATPLIGVGILGLAGLGLYSLFSSDHGDYNTIKGMQHKGWSAEMRKTDTDFGSRSDPLRAIARGLGLSLENLIKSKQWSRALREAKPVIREGKAVVFGRGSFGEAALYKTTIGGQEIQLVRKHIHEQAEENLSFLVNRAMEGVKGLSKGQYEATKASTEAYYRRSMNLRQESAFYTALSETPSVPSSYGVRTKKGVQELWMEHMPGSELKTVVEKQREFVMPEKARAELMESMSTAIEKGIYNPDIHYRNLLYDPATQRVSWLDFGTAEHTRLTAKQIGKMSQNVNDAPGVIQSLNAYIKKQKDMQGALREAASISEESAWKELRKSGVSKQELSGPPSIAEGPKARRKIDGQAKALQLARDLQKAKQAVWEAQHLGGNRHVIKRASQPVDQISVFADTIKPT